MPTLNYPPKFSPRPNRRYAWGVRSIGRGRSGCPMTFFRGMFAEIGARYRKTISRRMTTPW